MCLCVFVPLCKVFSSLPRSLERFQGENIWLDGGWERPQCRRVGQFDTAQLLGVSCVCACARACVCLCVYELPFAFRESVAGVAVDGG